MYYRIPLILTPQPEGGFVVTCPVLPELITEGDSVPDAIENAYDVFETVIEIYEDQGRALPDEIEATTGAGIIELEIAVPVPTAAIGKQNGNS
jgi:antitoxin HicB